MTFQWTLLLLAAAAFVAVMLAAGLTLSREKPKWPPAVAACPDYWEDQSVGTSGGSSGGPAPAPGAKCANVRGAGTCAGPVDFTASPYVGPGGACAKYKWAQACGAAWDGITSGVANPCL